MSVDAIRGTPAHVSVAPATLDEASSIMTEAAANGSAVAFVGGGTELGLGYAPARVDVLVRTSNLARVVDYAPADMVVEVEAGITLAALARELAPHGQRLALDAPYFERATVGGVVATNAFGPSRMRFGTVRDLIVGVSLVRADGERVRGGGKVVKNVAGFDIPKLAVGSLGSLGMIATATFRLHPLPESSRVLRVAACAGDLLHDIARDMLASRLEPTAFVAALDDTRRAYDAYVLFEGFETGVAEQSARFEALVRDRSAEAETVADAALPARLDEAARSHGDVSVRVAVPPASAGALVRDVLTPLSAVLWQPKIVVYPAAGIAFASGFTPSGAAAASALLAARAEAEKLAGNLVVTDVRSPEVAAAVDPYGTLPASFFLMRRLKDRFDPEHRLNPGRFLGRL